MVAPENKEGEYLLRRLAIIQCDEGIRIADERPECQAPVLLIDIEVAASVILGALYGNTHSRYRFALHVRELAELPGTGWSEVGRPSRRWDTVISHATQPIQGKLHSA